MNSVIPRGRQFTVTCDQFDHADAPLALTERTE